MYLAAARPLGFVRRHEERASARGERRRKFQLRDEVKDIIVAAGLGDAGLQGPGAASRVARPAGAQTHRPPRAVRDAAVPDHERGQLLAGGPRVHGRHTLLSYNTKGGHSQHMNRQQKC